MAEQDHQSALYLLYFVLAESRDEIGNQEGNVTCKVEHFMGHKGSPGDEVLLTHALYEEVPSMFQRSTACHGAEWEGG